MNVSLVYRILIKNGYLQLHDFLVHNFYYYGAEAHRTRSHAGFLLPGEFMRYKTDALTYRFVQLPDLLNLSKRTLRYAIKSGEFPPGKRLVGKIVGWPREDVEAWLASRPDASLVDVAAP